MTGSGYISHMADYITISEAAELIDANPRTVRRYCEDAETRDQLQAIKLGRDWLISRRAAEKFKKGKSGRPSKS